MRKLFKNTDHKKEKIEATIDSSMQSTKQREREREGRNERERKQSMMGGVGWMKVSLV